MSDALSADLTPKSNKDLRRERIVNTAKDLFLEQGYAATSMSLIAARLGGSKATLYAYFKNKEDLFAAMIRDLCDAIQAPLDLALDDHDDIHGALTNFASQMITALLSEQSSRLLRIVVSEAARDPEIGRILYRTGPARGMAKLADYFKQAQDMGLIAVPDFDMAAKQFISLCKGDLHFRRLLNIVEAPDPETIAREIEATVSMFLRAYAPRVN